jgi:hypothetical protein
MLAPVYRNVLTKPCVLLAIASARRAERRLACRDVDRTHWSSIEFYDIV